MSAMFSEMLAAWRLGDAQRTLDFAVQYAENAHNPTARARALHASILALTKMGKYDEARRILDDLIPTTDQQYEGDGWRWPPITYIFRDERIRLCHLMNDRESMDRFLGELGEMAKGEMREYAESFKKLRTDLAVGEVSFSARP